MSRRQCCVCGYNNRKGRCAEDIDRNQLCGCPTLQMQHCPKCDILSLYAIECMPRSISQGNDLKELTGNPLRKALFAAIAPPAFRLCRPYLSDGCPSSINFFLNSSLSVLYVIRPVDLSFSPCLDLVIALKRNRSLCWSMPATLMYFSNIATGHMLLEILAIRTSSPCLSWSVLFR